MESGWIQFGLVVMYGLMAAMFVFMLLPVLLFFGYIIYIFATL